MCWEERDVRVNTRPASFQLCELPLFSAFKWPKLEVPKNTTDSSVQGTASVQFPLFILHVIKETGLDVTTDYVDTHDKPLSNKMKPGGLHILRGSHAAPAVVVAIQELKARRRTGHFTATEMEQCVGFGLQLLTEEPMRESIICYLSDMHMIQFFCVRIDHIIRSEPMLLRGEGERWLAALFITDLVSLGYPAASRSVQFNARYCHYETFLGQGAHSLVFLPQRKPNDPNALPDDAIIKVDKSSDSESVRREFANLEMLRAAYAEICASAAAVAPHLAPKQASRAPPHAPTAASHTRSMVQQAGSKLFAPPTSVARASQAQERPHMPPAPANAAFVFAKMVPQVYKLSDCGSALRMDWRGSSVEFRRRTFPHLVDYLQLLHACGYAHTDIHQDNLVMRGNQVVAIDYGSLSPLYKPCIYRGNVVCASDRVLRKLRNGESLFPVFPADDLHSLVRCVFMLLVPQVGRFYFEESLRFARGTAGAGAADWKMPEFWERRLRGRIWEPMVRHAEECDYAALKADLQDLFLM